MLNDYVHKVLNKLPNFVGPWTIYKNAVDNHKSKRTKRVPSKLLATHRKM